MRRLTAILGILTLMNTGCQSSNQKSSSPTQTLKDPPRLRSTDWTAHDGKVMPFQSWLPNPGTKPKIILIATHGLSGASQDFWPLGERLPAKGIAIYAQELRGQGHDPDQSKHGDIANSELWANDLTDFTTLVRQRHPGIPVFWYGESLGSLITIHAITRKGAPKDISGLILASPVVELRQKLPIWKRALVEIPIRLLPWMRISLTDLAGKDASDALITSDTNHINQMKETSHFVEHLTFRLLGIIDRFIKQAPANAKKITIPTLIVHSPNDVFCSALAVERWYDRLATEDKERVVYKDSYHLLLHDKEGWEVVKKVGSWLLEHHPNTSQKSPGKP